MKQLIILGSSLAATTDPVSTTAINQSAAPAAISIILVVLIMIAATATLIVRNVKRSRWWRLRSPEGIATVYLFYRHGDRRCLAALRAFEDAGHTNKHRAEFFNCEQPFLSELAEEFGVKELPSLVVVWEGLVDDEPATHTTLEVLKEDSDVNALLDRILADAHSLAVPFTSRPEGA